MVLKLFHTFKKRKEVFTPLSKTIGLYTCGPTVYNFATVGNLRSYIFEDILKRTLLFNGFQVKHVMNITDVGHLTADSDDGEDKMEKSAREQKQTVWDIAKKYTQAFQHDLRDLNISEPDIWCKATDHIPEQIALIAKLEKKGYTYQTSDGIYFDTKKFPAYKKVSNLRGRIEENTEKRNPYDFALWKFSPKHEKRAMEWASPWGTGFPGWHIECSAMSMKYLGETLDIHCGGIDHISIHHPNEIAQSEAATGKTFARLWLHNEFLMVNGKRMGKSEGNLITLSEIKTKGFSPLAYRYFCLGTHYRQKINFTWKGLESAQTTLEKLSAFAASADDPKIGCAEYEEKFLQTLNDDLNTPKALALLWDLIHNSRYPSKAKLKSLLQFDKVLGLKIFESRKLKKSASREREADKKNTQKKFQKLLEQREVLRKAKKFAEADALRKQIEDAGYMIEDTADGQHLKKI